MKQINEDTATEIEGIEKFGSENRALVEDMARKSKADLQLFMSYVSEINTEIDKYNRQIEEKKAVLTK